MKKIITISIIIIVALGIGYFLFKISPDVQQTANTGSYTLDTSNPQPLATPPAFDPSKDHYLGDPKAKNVFIEYADYQCPACAAYNDMLKQVPATFIDTVFVYRYFPLVQIHQNAVEAALAAEAAGAQGKYWQMHDLLFAKQSEWESLSDPLNNFATYAQQAGVSNVDQFKSDVTSKKYIDSVQAGETQSLGLNLPGTPSFFFNGHTLKNGDLPTMQQEAQQWMAK